MEKKKKKQKTTVRFHLTPVRVTIIKVSQLSSVTQLCPTLCNPINCSTPGFPVHHQLLKLT